MRLQVRALRAAHHHDKPVLHQDQRAANPHGAWDAGAAQRLGPEVLAAGRQALPVRYHPAEGGGVSVVHCCTGRSAAASRPISNTSTPPSPAPVSLECQCRQLRGMLPGQPALTHPPAGAARTGGPRRDCVSPAPGDRCPEDHDIQELEKTKVQPACRCITQERSTINQAPQANGRCI
jgi:hypothetical protein